MKVLQVVHGFPPRRKTGTEILTYNLSKELAKRHDVHVLYPVYIKGGRKCYINSFKDEKTNIKIHELIIEENLWRYINKLLRFNLQSLSYKNNRLQKKFKEFLEDVKPDIVHFQHLLGLSISLPLVAKKYCKVVVNLNDYWLVCLTTHFLKADGKLCYNSNPKNCWRCLFKEWISLVKPLKMIITKNGGFGVKNYAVINNYILRKVCQAYGLSMIQGRSICAKQVIKCADKLIAASQCIVRKFIENGLIENVDLEKGKVVLLNPGIDANNLINLIKKRSNKIRFGYVGGIAERKGLHILIEAFRKLENAAVELRVYGFTVLDQSDEYHSFLLEKSKNQPKIRFMGQFEDVKEPYSNIDVLIVPSVTYEGYGLVVQEAFASKTPVIASNICALNEFIRHMRNGLLFEVGDSEDLAKKMRLIVENPDLLHKLEKNMSIVKSIEQYAKEIEKIYGEVTNKN